jgi:hypothetical protein
MDITPTQYENLKAELRHTIELYGMEEVKETLRALEIIDGNKEGFNGRMPRYF